MDTHEMSIAYYLTAGGTVFIAPQFSILYDEKTRDGGTCPDFVALDFTRKHVVVVEVSSASNIDSLIKRIKGRESNWYIPLRRAFHDSQVVNKEWRIRFLGFIRDDNIERARGKFSTISDGDITFYDIKNATFSWEYWNEREAGLPNESKSDEQLPVLFRE